MKEQIVSFKVANLAKEKGFDIECGSFYTKDHILLNSSYKYSPFLCIASTQSLLQKWLREKHNMSVEIGCTITKFWIWHIYEISSGELLLGFIDHNESYEEALEQGLFETLKLI